MSAFCAPECMTEGCSTRNVCLPASVPALGRTRHPFAVSGFEELTAHASQVPLFGRGFLSV
jgi:hypothetical protein